jgi:hypothetical protein
MLQKLTLEKLDEVVWIALIWLRIGASEHGYEPSGSVKCCEILQ